MKKTVIYCVLFVLCAWVNSACDTDPLSSAQACTQLTGLALEYVNASASYSSNPSTATCNAYKTAGTKYLSALKKCSTSSSAQIDQVKAAMDALTC